MLLASAAYADNYPSKPLRIVTSEAGGNFDMVARIRLAHARESRCRSGFTG
jgi:tripartite-type tricarboxylate transporter receptor subunit TctC